VPSPSLRRRLGVAFGPLLPACGRRRSPRVRRLRLRGAGPAGWGARPGWSVLADVAARGGRQV